VVAPLFGIGWLLAYWLRLSGNGLNAYSLLFGCYSGVRVWVVRVAYSVSCCRVPPCCPVLPPCWHGWGWPVLPAVPCWHAVCRVPMLARAGVAVGPCCRRSAAGVDVRASWAPRGTRPGYGTRATRHDGVTGGYRHASSSL
jgi:hypothetical protein